MHILSLGEELCLLSHLQIVPIASKQIALSLSRPCIMQSMVLSLDSIFQVYASVSPFSAFHRFIIQSVLHTSTGYNTLTSVPPAPRVQRGLYPAAGWWLCFGLVASLALLSILKFCRAVRRERRSVPACSVSFAFRFCAPAPVVGVGGVDARQ